MKKVLKIVGGICILLLIAAIAWLILRKDNIVSYETAVEECKTPNSHFYTWNGLQCHYEVIGTGTDTILMIHGFGGSHKNFEKVAELMKNEATMYLIDLPAFGLSQVPDLTMPNDEILGFYRSFLDESVTQLGIDSFDVWGNSLGGWLAWDFTARNQEHVASLVLLNAAGFGMENAKKTATGWMTSPLGKLFLKTGIPISKAKENAEGCMWDKTKVYEENVYNNYIMNNKEHTLSWMIKMAQSNVMPDTALLGKITCPTLIIWGNEDAIINVESAPHFKNNIQNSQLVVFEHCGHVPMIEEPEKTKEFWERFIEEIY